MLNLPKNFSSSTFEDLSKHQVISIDFLSNNIMSVEVIPNTRSINRHMPGQYCKILSYDNTFKSYSIINTGNSLGSLEFYIRLKKSSRDLVLQHFQRGNIVLLSKFYSSYLFDFNNVSPVVFIAEGLGITAFLSIIENISNKQESTLLWMAPQDDQEICLNIFSPWMDNSLSLTTILSKEKSLIEEALKKVCDKYLKQVESLCVYYAGSSDFNLQIKSVLHAYIERGQLKLFADI